MKAFRFAPDMGAKAIRRASSATGLSEHLIFVETFTRRNDRRFKNHMMEYLTTKEVA